MSKPTYEDIVALNRQLANQLVQMSDNLQESALDIAEKAWDEGFKQGGPMHDENYDDPGAHRRNPYTKIKKEKAGL